MKSSRLAMRPEMMLGTRPGAVSAWNGGRLAWSSRRTAASYLAMNGATLAEIAEVLGHKTLAMVKRYSHLTEQHTSSVVAKMNAAVFGE